MHGWRSGSGNAVGFPAFNLAAVLLLELRMSSPSIVPSFDTEVYLVLDDFGKLGCAYRETEEEKADRGTIVRNLISGEYNAPVRVVAFNTSEGWARDVSEDVANEVVEVARLEYTNLPTTTLSFVERYLDDLPAWPVA